ncbi:hypothetical protein BVRB_3g064860 [Beta vulgaris subsp. vulgaris]|nr:hypothetical protein BVRB_3g064860 [Beta vulgaris subsp. vulgaris]
MPEIMKTNTYVMVLLLILAIIVVAVTGAPAAGADWCSVAGDPCGVWELSWCCSGSCDNLISGTCH